MLFCFFAFLLFAVIISSINDNDIQLGGRNELSTLYVCSK